ncbi:MAG: RNA-binding S4 domain-containing protein [Litoreibacter sp.]|nr:RNA-binding S4 domain-containing protein [Litoreibacter sp.]MCY4333304.1 RNA-binding S4 domain-containing protein [Litoreibacter sp.]
MSEGRETIRLDKWLWQARFFKTRTLAASVVKAGNVRVNALKISKPAFQVGEGDGITFPQGDQTRVVVVQACGTRRGPAPEAQTLYLDKTVYEEKIPRAVTPWGKGRPTKKDRRILDLSRKPPLE